jgi:hypothetical protein
MRAARGATGWTQPNLDPHDGGSGLAVPALVLVSWFLCPVLGGVMAVVSGHVARGPIRRAMATHTWWQCRDGSYQLGCCQWLG